MAAAHPQRQAHDGHPCETRDDRPHPSTADTPQTLRPQAMLTIVALSASGPSTPQAAAHQAQLSSMPASAARASPSAVRAQACFWRSRRTPGPPCSSRAARPRTRAAAGAAAVRYSEQQLQALGEGLAVAEGCCRYPEMASGHGSPGRRDHWRHALQRAVLADRLSLFDPDGQHRVGLVQDVGPYTADRLQGPLRSGASATGPRATGAAVHHSGGRAWCHAAWSRRRRGPRCRAGHRPGGRCARAPQREPGRARCGLRKFHLGLCGFRSGPGGHLPLRPRGCGSGGM